MDGDGLIFVGWSDISGGWSIGSDRLLSYNDEKDFWACSGLRSDVPTAYQVWHHGVPPGHPRTCVSMNLRAEAKMNVTFDSLPFYYVGEVISRKLCILDGEKAC